MNPWLRLRRTDVPQALTDDELEEVSEMLSRLVEDYRPLCGTVYYDPEEDE